jgi:dolichyl-phosphate beta-glucosyltransferase
MKKKTLSIIIPAFNEEDIIQKACSKVNDYLKERRINGEIVVVDDGSNDSTRKKVGMLNEDNISIMSLKTNTGKGAALREGFLKTNAKYKVFMDADLSVPVEYLDFMLDELKDNDVVIGSRRIKKSRIKVHQPWLRENMGRGFTFLTRLITGTNISDFTCGFKGFTSKAAEDIFGNSKIERWAYDAEVLFLAHKYGYKIKEIPVEWKNREATRVKLGSATVTSFKDLVLMRINDLLGKYEKSS